MPETRDDVARRNQIDLAWRTFVASGLEPGGVGPEILRSWRRARETFAIDPGQRRCTRLLSADELGLRREVDDTYRLALPILEEFGARLATTRQVLAYLDAGGWMLSAGGNPAIADRLAEINFAPGASWSEESVGTNGPGTALAERRPIEVFASEHFVEAWQYWSCSAAPIVDSASGAILGLVDLTGPWAAHDVQALVAARAIAHAVEERVRSARIVREQVVEYAFRMAAGAGEGLFAVDRRGRVLAVNDAARRKLAFDGLDVPLPIRERLESALRDRAAPEAELSLECPERGGAVRLLAAPVRYEESAVGAVVRVVSAPSPARPRPAPRGAAVAPAARYTFESVLGASESIRRAVALGRLAARNDLPVVLEGESGTGKELFAQAIHSASARRDGPFVAVNCGCIPASLLEAELFGYEAGTFTGARRDGNAGKFEEACGGTLFLDEVSELSGPAQTALLRVLQEREVVRLGASMPRRVDIRVVAASNKGLAEEIRAGRFRADLFFRLNVLSIAVPALRERRADVPLLADAFLREAQAELGRAGLTFSEGALAALAGYGWPGNVRELRNVVLRTTVTAPGGAIRPGDLPEEVRCGVSEGLPPAHSGATVLDAPSSRPGHPDRDAVLRALESCSWNVARAAQGLHVSRMTLYRWLRKLGIER